MQQARVGELSMWKACAMPNAGRNAVFAALLAKEGLTGPGAVFEGRYGFFKVVSGPFELEEFGGKGKPFRIMDVSIKRYPCGQFSQTAVDAAIALRSKIDGTEKITEIHVDTFNYGKLVMGGDPEKWRPKTRESADHSIPYVVGVALMYGSITPEHFSEAFLNNPDLLELIQKIIVEETEECNDLYPSASANRVSIITHSGQRYSKLVRYHRGHHSNPQTNEEIEQKFHTLAEDLIPPSKRKQLLEMLWQLEQVDDVSRIMELLVVEPLVV
jgi:2-methylcitrate dehydratase